MSGEEHTHLQRVINHGEYVLNCLLFGDVSHQIYKCLSTLEKNEMNVNHCFQMCKHNILMEFH